MLANSSFEEMPSLPEISDHSVAMVGPSPAPYRILELDSGLKRSFSFRERYGLQLQAEAFNTANTPHSGNPGGLTVGTSSFGTITATAGFPSDNREFRLSGRITF
jgi:hypothetical protein